MPDLTVHEGAALELAGAQAGAYLESIQKTDLATLTEDEWGMFLQTVFTTATKELGRLVEESSLPF